MKRRPEAPVQYIVFGQGISAIARGRISASRSAAARPGSNCSTATYSPRGVLTDEKLLHTHAMLAGKALGDARWCILRIESYGLRRTGDFAPNIFLLQSNARAGGHQSPRSAKGNSFRAIDQILEREIFVQVLLGIP